MGSERTRWTLERRRYYSINLINHPSVYVVLIVVVLFSLFKIVTNKGKELLVQHCLLLWLDDLVTNHHVLLLRVRETQNRTVPANGKRPTAIQMVRTVVAVVLIKRLAVVVKSVFECECTPTKKKRKAKNGICWKGSPPHLKKRTANRIKWDPQDQSTHDLDLLLIMYHLTLDWILRLLIYAKDSDRLARRT